VHRNLAGDGIDGFVTQALFGVDSQYNVVFPSFQIPYFFEPFLGILNGARGKFIPTNSTISGGFSFPPWCSLRAMGYIDSNFQNPLFYFLTH
jgi:hypothetical protein